MENPPVEMALCNLGHPARPVRARIHLEIGPENHRENQWQLHLQSTSEVSSQFQRQTSTGECKQLRFGLKVNLNFSALRTIEKRLKIEQQIERRDSLQIYGLKVLDLNVFECNLSNLKRSFAATTRPERCQRRVPIDGSAENPVNILIVQRLATWAERHEPAPA